LHIQFVIKKKWCTAFQVHGVKTSLGIKCFDLQQIARIFMLFFDILASYISTKRSFCYKTSGMKIIEKKKEEKRHLFDKPYNQL